MEEINIGDIVLDDDINLGDIVLDTDIIYENDHSKLKNRDLPNQHPISAITNLEEELNDKQEILVSGENIKTINNQSILGEGNIDIQGGGGTGDYEDLDNLPSINNVELIGNKTIADLGLQPAGNYASTQSVENINSKIPNQATAINQLADKDFVNSSISTATATFRGTFDSLNTLQATEGDKNDYAFYCHTDSAGNTVYDRYKYVGSKEVILPTGYTQVKSIRGNYIDTHLVPQLNWHFILTFSSPRLETYYDEPIFGTTQSGADYNIFKAGYTDQTRADIGSGLVSASLTNNDVHVVEVKSSGAVYFDGVQKGILNKGTGIPTVSLYLLAINRPNQYPYIWTGQSSFYGLKIYDNEENLLMDLVPCIRDQDGSIGVYDLAGTINPDTNSSFYSGATSYTPLSIDKWEYEYSLNNSSYTAEQWAAINSGVTSNTVSSVANIETLIPNNATILNQLADKDFVNSSISTATADFKGTFTDLATLQATDGNRNDYAFYSHQDSLGNTVYDRYKYVGLPETRVPEGYTEVYSIGRSASQGGYLNTGIILKNNYTIETTMTFGAVDYYTNRFYWGAHDGTNYFRLQKPATSVLKLDSSTGSSNTISIDNTEYLIEVKNNKFYVNGSVSGSAVVPNISDDYPLYLFGYNNQGSGTSNGTITVNFHSFKIWNENGELILDLVPCLNYENQAGMYDVVSGQFFGGSYSTVSLTTDKWQYEYSLNNSSFTAAQWETINSGLTNQVATDITTINSKIPSQASSNNQLADRDFVESAISTATATFKGTFTDLATLQATDGDRNDYAFYSHQDTAGNTLYDRYKYVGLPDTRVPEGYTERLYVTQTRYETSYIDTGYKLQSTDKIVIKYYGFEYTANQAYLLGASDSNNNYIRLRKEYGSSNVYMETNNGSVLLGAGYNRSFIIEVYDGKVYVSDIDGSNKQLKGSLTLSSVDANLYIFRLNGNGTPAAAYDQRISIGDFTIYDSNEDKVLELVPCTNSLSVNGYYETVGKTFIEPIDGTLNAQAISTDKWLYEYSLNNSGFTSTQWATINSGLTSSSLDNYVTNTDYAQGTTAGVIKVDTAVGTYQNNGLLGATTKSYSQYQTLYNDLFIGKGTLENVITGKGLVSDTDYATDSKAGVIKSNVGLEVSGSTGLVRATTFTYEEYLQKGNVAFIGKGTLENVFAGKGLDVKTYTGYDATKTQILKNINGTLTWVDET